MDTINLSSFHLIRPERIRWHYAYTDDLLPHIPSKSLRQFLSQVDLHLQENQIEYRFISELTKEEYLEWLAFYRQKMVESGHEIIADEARFDQKKAEGKKVSGLFFYKNRQLVGSGIMISNSDMATLAFKAHDHIDLSKKDNSNLGGVIEYLFFKEAQKLGVKLISSGRSRNEFGVINSLGYLDAKLRFGLTPAIEQGDTFLDSVSINDQGFVVFFGKNTQTQTEGFYLLKKPETQVNINKVYFEKLQIPLTEITLL